MALRKILEEHEPILRKISKPVVVFDKALKELFVDMEETMKKADGAGLSAVQVGILKRAFIIANRKDKYCIVNPEILSQSGHNRDKLEGCLSLPGKCGIVDRPNEITAVYQDLEGKKVEQKFTGFMAKAFCHEFDHLNGILYSDKAEKMFNSYDDYYKYKDKQEKKENTKKSKK